MGVEFRKVKYVDHNEAESHPLEADVEFDTIGVYNTTEGIEQDWIADIEPDVFKELVKDYLNLN